MANGLTVDPGLSIPTGLSVTVALAAPGGGLSTGGFAPTPTPPVIGNALLWGTDNPLQWGAGNNINWGS